MTTATASPTQLPGSDGECGYQHGMAPCLPMQGRTCCSINGFCGFNETYCFVSNGCQYGCVDPSAFYSTLTTILTVSTNGASGSASISHSTITSKPITTTSATSPTHSPTTTAASSGGLTGKARTGAIVGATVGSVALFALLAWLFICIRSRRRADGTAGGKSNPNNAKPPTAENREAHAGLMSASNFHIVHYDENNRANER